MPAISYIRLAIGLFPEEAKYSSGIWKYVKMAEPQRPAPPCALPPMYTGFWRRSLARSADVTTAATAPSVSMV